MGSDIVTIELTREEYEMLCITLSMVEPVAGEGITTFQSLLDKFNVYQD